MGTIDMTKGYWIGRVDVIDANRNKQYTERNGDVFARYGAQFLVRSGASENPEGASRSRNVVIEFPSYQASLDCYRSPAYQELVALRAPAGINDLVIIEGYEGPQPTTARTQGDD